MKKAFKTPAENVFIHLHPYQLRFIKYWKTQHTQEEIHTSFNLELYLEIVSIRKIK